MSSPSSPPPAKLSDRIMPEIAWFRKRFARQLHGVTGPEQTLDLATAENWLIREDLMEPMRRAMSRLGPADLSYSSGLGGNKSLMRAAAGFFNEFFRPRRPVEPGQIVAGPGASALLDALVYCICDEGDTILVEAPYWGDFEIYCTLRNKVHLRPVYPPGLTPGEDLDQQAYIGAFEEAIADAAVSGSKVKAVLFCNPNNPLASVYGRETIESLLRFCQRKQLHFISDEVYALTAFHDAHITDQGSQPQEMGIGELEIEEGPQEEFVSVLSLNLVELGVDASRVHLLHSTSKDLGSSGLRMGFLVTSDPALRFDLAILNHNKVSNVTSLITEHLLTDLSELRAIISHNARRLAAAAWIVQETLERRNIVYLKPTAGVYIWARVGGADCSWEREAELTRQFGMNGVSVGNGTDYAAPQAGWFRITFAVSREQLVLGLQRITAVLDHQSD